MVTIRDFTLEDIPSLEVAITADQFHRGEWKVEHFQLPNVPTKVVEDEQGPLAFVLYTRDADGFMRISCVWADTNPQRNARGMISGIPQMALFACQHGFGGLVIETSHDKLAVFLVRVLKFQRGEGNDYFLKIDKETVCAGHRAH